MRRRSLHLLIAFIWLVSLTGCQSLVGGPPNRLDLVGQYTYQDGQPVFTVLPGESSPFIVYRKQPIQIEGHQVTIRLNDVSIDVTPSRPLIELPELGRTDQVTATSSSPSRLPRNYKISRIVTAQEMVEGQWEEYSEFHPGTTPVSRIGVVIVVDSSKSIDRQLGAAKSTANYLSALLAQRWGDRVWLSVLPLDPAGVYLDFTTDLNEVSRYISQLDTMPYTSLYDTLDAACAAFDSFEERQTTEDRPLHFDKRWILLLTDGKDNYSEQNTLESVRQRLGQCRVAVYALGINALDKLDETDLRAIAQDRFSSLTGLELEKLRERQKLIVDTMEAQSPALYDVTYVRNDQTITEPRKIKLTFEIAN
ncbi:MAG: VWA domain-containing protein [Anaerolineae bacterium]|nr:VWA domain-containing protein [Anaerolineae bacterium]MCB9130513.1 VWA domain-containing protein [Anaerolineales bacterium]